MLATRTTMTKYDIAIIGAGASGLTAAIYAGRYKMKTAVFGELMGGTATLAHKVENYPGVESASGIELMQTFKRQAESFGAEIKDSKTKDIQKEGNLFIIKTESGDKVQTKTVILATGTIRRKLDIPGEKELLGKGLSYCVTCDGPFFRDKEVAVVGGGDAGVTGALMLSKYAKKVYIIHRRDEFRAEPTWVGQLKSKKNVELVMERNAISFEGKEKLESVELDKEYNGSKNLKVDGAFIEIGSIPQNDLAKKLGLKLDEEGHIEVGENQRTSQDGIFAAGDVTNNSFEYDQLTTAVGEGSIAAFAAYRCVSDRHCNIDKASEGADN